MIYHWEGTGGETRGKKGTTIDQGWGPHLGDNPTLTTLHVVGPKSICTITHTNWVEYIWPRPGYFFHYTVSLPMEHWSPGSPNFNLWTVAFCGRSSFNVPFFWSDSWSELHKLTRKQALKLRNKSREGVYLQKLGLLKDFFWHSGLDRGQLAFCGKWSSSWPIKCILPSSFWVTWCGCSNNTIFYYYCDFTISSSST